MASNVKLPLPEFPLPGVAVAFDMADRLLDETLRPVCPLFGRGPSEELLT
jgi:hypothetical protein